jgi:predicted component of type VI protein secretion system
MKSAIGLDEGISKMARTRTQISIDVKIEKAQEKVVCEKAKYDAAVAELKRLMEKRDAMRKDALMSAITGSDKSYEEILSFLKGTGDD